jgi:hypothetical protein
LQQDLLVQGLLRTDGGGEDTPFAARDLERNFIDIALFDEYRTQNGQLVADPVASRLNRWNRPVRLSVRFGATTPPDQQAKDRMAISDYADRLSSVTGHPVRVTNGPGNFTILILNEDERRGYEAELRTLIPDLDQPTLTAFLDMPRSTLCYVVTLSDPQRNTGYLKAVAIIRAEHPDLLRLSCIHEEIAQGLGLANDSPSARPSIFNDNEEFGLLTNHDALLLQMLYDPQLKTGMTEAEARPIIRALSRQLTGELPLSGRVREN